MLKKKFADRLADSHSTAGNPHLMLLKDSVDAVEAASAGHRELKYFMDELNILLDKPNFAVVPTLTNEFAQLLGEAHFLTLCSNKGVELARIPGVHGVKTPDFETVGNPSKMYFEVKTVSVVGGDFGIADSLNGAMDANIRIAEQIKGGARIAMAEQSIAPYGDKPHTENGSLTAVINTLIDKARQNLKKDQFKHQDTFLVLNLSVLEPFETSKAALRPSYPSKLDYVASVTGELWMAAFGQPGMLVQTIPEFPGKPAIEGLLSRTGILSDPDNDFVAGILFIIHPWGAPAQMLGLFRAEDMEAWDDAGARSGPGQSEVSTTLRQLLGDDWNDSRDTNGWALARHVDV